MKKEVETSMDELCILLSSNEIKYVIRKHPHYDEESTRIIGYSPVGEWQIVIEDHTSIIRGFITNGNYEVMQKGKGLYRTEIPEEVIKRIKKQRRST